MPDEKTHRPRAYAYTQILVEALALLTAIGAADLAFVQDALPPLATVAAIACLLLAPWGRSTPETPRKSAWLSRLPVWAAVGAVSAGVFFFWAKPDPRFYGYLGIWMGLVACWYGRRALLTAGQASVSFAVKTSLRLRLDAGLGYLLILWVFLGPGKGFLPPTSVQGGSDLAHAAAERVLLLYLFLSLLAYTGVLAVLRRSRQPVAENLRLIALGTVWVFLMRPFFTVILQGTPDALWYGTMLADMIEQVRKGVFPVFVGQSPFQFNGAIYPLRVAPAFHYLGALVDTLTFRSLGGFAVQNLLLSLQALAAITVCYASLSALIPGRPWLACALAVLFACCPGVLGMVYNTDLYMSWMTVPFLPVALCGLVRAHRGADLPSLLMTGGALGAMWWGHTPIALWSTLLVGSCYLYLFIRQRPGIAEARRAALAAAVFGAIAAYPVVSVLFYPPKAGVKSASFQEATQGTVMYFLNQAFPSTLLPLSHNGRSLSDFQAGYSLWALFTLAAWAVTRTRRSDLRVLLAMACLLIALLTPIPGLTGALWSAVPAFVRNTTGNWVMNRLYLPLAGSLVFAGAVAVPLLVPRRRWQALLMGLLCSWSLLQAHRFAMGSENQRPLESAKLQLQSENVMVTQFAYLVFPRRPDTFTHGVADPYLENRLLDRATLAETASNTGSITIGPAAATELTFEVDAEKYDSKAWSLRDPIVLEPGRRYVAEFEFDHPGADAGVLQLAGPSFLREYQLPDFGGSLAFGSGASHSRRLSLWTSGSSSEALSVHFFPSNPRPLEPSDSFGRIRIAEYRLSDLPVRVDSWIPYEARVRAPAESWLETPRMYQTWYRAVVNGAPAQVRESPLGLVMVGVPAGESRVVLTFEAPLGLRAAFYLSLAAALAWAAWLIRGFARAVPVSLDAAAD